MTQVEFSATIASSLKALRPFAMRLTRNVEDANDLLQDTMLKAFTHRDKFSDGTNLKAWLYTIMKNTFITNYQKMVRKRTFIDSTENLHFLNAPNHVTHNMAIGTFTMEDINGALNLLDEVYRSPFMMYYRGFKYHEIAEKLDIPIGTVKNRIHLARKALKTSLKIYSL